MKSTICLNTIGKYGIISHIIPLDLQAQKPKGGYLDSEIMACNTLSGDSSGILATSSNMGQTFLENVWVSKNSNNGFVCTSSNGRYIFFSTQNGLARLKDGVFQLLLKVTPTDIRISEDGKFILVTTSLGFYISQDWGNTFNRYAPTLNMITCVVSKSGQYMACFQGYSGAGMKMYFSNNFGNSFVERNQPDYVKNSGISSSGLTIFSGYSDNVALYRYTNNGAVVATCSGTNGVNTDCYPSFTSVGNFVAVAGYGSSGCCRVSTDNGVTWSLPTNGNGSFYCCKFSGNGKFLYALKNTAYLYTGTSSDSFATLTQGVYIGGRYMDVSYDGKIIIVGNTSNQNIRISYDYGQTFKSVGASRMWGRVCLNTRSE